MKVFFFTRKFVLTPLPVWSMRRLVVEVMSVRIVLFGAVRSRRVILRSTVGFSRASNVAQEASFAKSSKVGIPVIITNILIKV